MSSFLHARFRHIRRMQKSDTRPIASNLGCCGRFAGLVLALLLTSMIRVTTASAATLAGVTLPNIRVVDGTRLQLNGMGLRTYSIFGIHIYVAGLYLEHRSDNADSILHSPEKKVLIIRFLRDVNQAEAQKAWREGFANNCQMPECYIDPKALNEFISAVPAIHNGDETVMTFTDHDVVVQINGKSLGDIKEPHYAETLLRTFIGRVPPTAALKRELLGQGE